MMLHAAQHLVLNDPPARQDGAFASRGGQVKHMNDQGRMTNDERQLSYRHSSFVIRPRVPPPAHALVKRSQPTLST
jgi:hypothetical protein